jgi:two-component system, chemotaxis family, protein-glutamate methylesterase/glutaminase
MTLRRSAAGFVGRENETHIEHQRATPYIPTAGNVLLSARPSSYSTDCLRRFRIQACSSASEALLPNRDIVVIGGSAGALEALSAIVSKLPHDFAATVFVVIHTSPTRESFLPAILRRAGRIDTEQPRDKQPIERGRIYVAQPDRHMLLEDGHIRIVHGPKENRSRPAIDPLFRSAALYYGSRAIGVVLSGSLDDGTAGLRAIKKSGGITVVQDPLDAIYRSMPESAIYNNDVDHIVKADEIAMLLRQLIQEEIRVEGATAEMEHDLKKEDQIVKQKLESNEMIEAANELGNLSIFTCPECHGSLWELKDNELLRYRCHVGHAFSIDSLDAEQAEKVEAGLWSAMRALEERGALSRRLAKQSRERGRDPLAQRFEERAKEADEHVENIRQMLLADAEQSVLLSP